MKPGLGHYPWGPRPGPVRAQTRISSNPGRAWFLKVRAFLGSGRAEVWFWAFLEFWRLGPQVGQELKNAPKNLGSEKTLEEGGRGREGELCSTPMASAATAPEAGALSPSPELPSRPSHGFFSKWFQWCALSGCCFLFCSPFFSLVQWIFRMIGIRPGEGSIECVMAGGCGGDFFLWRLERGNWVGGRRGCVVVS